MMRVLACSAVAVVDGIALPEVIITKTDSNVFINVHENVRFDPYSRRNSVDVFRTMRIGLASIVHLVADKGLRCPGKPQHLPGSSPIHASQPAWAIAGLIPHIKTTLPC